MHPAEKKNKSCFRPVANEAAVLLAHAVWKEVHSDMTFALLSGCCGRSIKPRRPLSVVATRQLAATFRTSAASQNSGAGPTQ